MDEIDKDIIFHLQENARISFTELGKQVGLSTPAVTERVKKLEDKNIIQGYKAVINSDKLNKPIMAMILYDHTKCDLFIEFCRKHPEVIECHRLAGKYNFIVKIVTATVETLESFIDESMKYGQPSTLIRLSSPVVNKPIS